MLLRGQVRGRPPAEPRLAAGDLARPAGRAEAAGVAEAVGVPEAAGVAETPGDAGPLSGPGG